MMIADLDVVYCIEQAAHRAPWSKDIIHYCLMASYDCRVLCLKNDAHEKIIAFYISRTEEADAHLLNICILPEYQGQGLGMFLMTHYLNKLKALGVDEALLEVRPSNFIALSLYDKLGFVKIGIKEHYYKDIIGTENAWVLSLNLATWLHKTV